ncbi:hypothetical protein GW17_00061179 [Ensete ventricosum]|nr:hypothetical protein GW17_00061179 [Ensete ventricosum]
MTETIIDGDAFNVVVEGAADAPAILLAHSLGTNLHAFDRQIAALAPHFRLVRFDARGHGGSRVSEGPYTIDQLGRDALAILDALDIDKAHFVGLSAGGLLGLWLLRHAPERIGRAVLANIAAQIGSPDFWDERIRVVKEKGTEAIAAALVENWFTRAYRAQHPEEVQRFEQALAGMSAEGYAGLAAAVRDANFREDLDAIRHPVLVIVGKHDPMTPPGVGALVGSAIPGAKTVALEAAHLSPVEAAEAFNDAVLEFLLGAAETADAEVPAEPPPKKPRKPRAPKPKPAPAATLADEPAAEPAPVAPPKPRPRPAPKPKAKEERAPEPAPAARPARKSAAKKPAKKTPRKAAVKKQAVKKAAVKKTARKLAVKKRVARKAPVKKSPVRKAAVKRRPLKKVAKKPARKAVAKKAATKKATVKKTTRKVARRPVKKAAVKKTARRSMRRR